MTQKVLITGHTGFKGTWLTLYLEELGFEVYGFSLPATHDSMFERLQRKGKIDEVEGDIRDYETIRKYVKQVSPEYVFHLAAQPLVLQSYENPRETFDINVQGTSNLLDASMSTNSIKSIGIITTDKVYKNDNKGISFIETDPLEGKDPYSASKVAAEAVTFAWQNISSQLQGPQIKALRAGNVIGGGDMAKDRLLPDLIRSFESKTDIFIRHPESTRPWQHVLDPIIGYVAAVLQSNLDSSLAYNFSPSDSSLTVSEIVDIAAKTWGYKGNIVINRDNSQKYEAEKLQLNSNLARRVLGWEPKWTQEEAVISTVQWWKKVLDKKIDPAKASVFDLEKVLG